MSGFTENRASGASDSSGRREMVYNLGTGRKLLPLLRQIAGDLASRQQQRARLIPEQSRLDRQKISLNWAGRQRRYQVQEEIQTLDRQYAEALTELDDLGVVLIEATEGCVGLPTVVNRQLAYFSWKLGEESCVTGTSRENPPDPGRLEGIWRNAGTGECNLDAGAVVSTCCDPPRIPVEIFASAEKLTYI